MSVLASPDTAGGGYLVIGGDSLIGMEITRRLRGADQMVQVTSRRSRHDAIQLDLAHLDLMPFLDRRFHCAFVCAAIANMRACEEAERETSRINVDATLSLMRRLAD